MAASKERHDVICICEDRRQRVPASGCDECLPLSPADMTDAELNEACAVEVMEWTCWDQYQLTTRGEVQSLRELPPRTWSPATDSGTAIDDVVAEMRRRGFDVDIYLRAERPLCALRTETRSFAAWANTLARAICEAALAAVRADEKATPP